MQGVVEMRFLTAAGNLIFFHLSWWKEEERICKEESLR